MNNVDRAAEEIRRVDGNHTLGAGALAEALSDAGLLMPNFPEPDQDGEYPAGEFYISGGDGFIDIYRYPAVLVASLMPFEVDDLIAALAAAHHAEQEQGNE